MGPAGPSDPMRRGFDEDHCAAWEAEGPVVEAGVDLDARGTARQPSDEAATTPQKGREEATTMIVQRFRLRTRP
jgi:hypothetical protein